MLAIYSFLISLYGFAIRIASIFNPKAKQWVVGRKDIFQKLEKNKSRIQHAIWFHCASLGEFEQGRPLIEKIREADPNQKIVLSFYSPSGYEIQKKYSKVDYVFYLPLDTKKNAKIICEILKPKAFILVKYEFWFNLLKHLNDSNIPTVLISGIFRPNQFFFKFYGLKFLKILSNFDHLFIQRKADAKLLQSKGFKNFTLGGDTRLDRVIQISNEHFEDSFISDFVESHKKILVAGSTWPKDEILIKEAMDNDLLENYKVIIAPHEIDGQHIGELKEKFPNANLYSSKNVTTSPILIIDKIGILSYIYRYGNIAYVGGGFGKGIHNILEAAVYEIPVLCGPNWQKFEEASRFIENKAAFEVNNSNNLVKILSNLGNDDQKAQHIKNYLNKYKMDNQGVIEKIFLYLISAKIINS